MANILVLGVGPLPFEPSNKLHAPGLRTWQLAEVLSAQHHFITIGLIEFGDFQAGDKKPKKGAPRLARRDDLGHNVGLIRFQYHPEETLEALRTLHMATRFASIVSTTDIMNGLAADLHLNVPCWLDYNGDPFAEKQLQAYVHKHDGSLADQWRLYLRGLHTGDRFSCASPPQRHAMIGHLAFAGRLTAANSGEELVHVMPNCSRFMTERTPKRTTILKGYQIPASSFLVLWTGGYNSWSDPETLYDGLALAMEQDEGIHFASTGGAIEGHDTRSFDIFKEKVEQSRFRDRFVFLGWRSTEEVASFYEQADLAIFTDRLSVEGELGTRTRLVDWIQYKIPIACTKLCEFTHQLAANSLIETFDIGDAASLARAIRAVKSNPEKSKTRASQALEWFESEFAERQVFGPLVQWASHPSFAQDRKPALDNASAKELGWISELGRLHRAAALDSNYPETKQDSTPAPGRLKKLKSLFSRGG